MRKMKESGVEWIGTIPYDWKLLRLKNVAEKFCNGSSETQLSSGESEYPVTRIETISKGIIDYTKVGYVEYLSAKYKLEKYDFLISNINSIAYLGNCAIFLKEKDLYHGMNLLRISPTLINKWYLFYYFKSLCFKRNMQIICKPAINQASVSSSSIKNMRIPFPNAEEQQIIANYLNKKCAEIDALTADIKKQIETLEEYKRSVITEAVTKGLDPDVEMIDSGMEFVGKIPASWNAHPLYYYFDERKNKNMFGNESNLLSLSYGNVIRKDINSNGGLLPESFNTYNIVEKGDIIIRPTDLQNDKRSLRTGLVKEHGIITSAYIALKAIKNINVEYVHYLLHSFDIMKVFYNMGNGVRQGLNFSEFSRLQIFEPSIEEQDKIVKYLNRKVSEIDGIISTKTKQLETIAEYKKSLIYEYVTGKKEV